MKYSMRVAPLVLTTAMLLSGCGQAVPAGPSGSAEWISSAEQADQVSQGRALLEQAFLCDLSGVEPTAEEMEDRLSLRFTAAEDDVYLVEYSDTLAYPATLYHLNHFGADEGFDLAQESEDYFKPELVETAKEFVASLYGVDCDGAEVSAYGYANKIAVQLNTAEGQAFSVRFYYADSRPTGVLFWNRVGAFEQSMERDGAKEYLPLDF